MSKTLFLLRHAKSSWAETDKRDKDRALKAKGISDIINLASAFGPKLKGLDLIITSSANRAVHTAILFAEAIGFPHGNIRIEPAIYQTDDQELLDMIKALPDEFNSTMVVGHNPTLTHLVNHFITNGIYEMPTSGLVGIEFSVDSWKNISQQAVKSVFKSFD